MKPLDYMNLSTDLRRIAVWLVDGDEKLAKKFIDINRRKFELDRSLFGKRELSVWIGRIEEVDIRGWQSAEDALTLSVLLKNRFSR